MSEHEAKQATPAAELERQIMGSNVPKNEREWWAAGEIERLRAGFENAAKLIEDLADHQKRLTDGVAEKVVKLATR